MKYLGFSVLIGLLFATLTFAANTAVIPIEKLEQDSYDWYARHAEVLALQQQLDPQVVLIGDSITHFWAGPPAASIIRGAESFKETFGELRVLNLGFGWDRTQNVLWRLANGEMEGLTPKLIVLHIGTNNTSTTPNARANTPEEIVEGIAAICRQLTKKAPEARIILMDVFPREAKPDHPRRKVIRETNRLLAAAELPYQVIRLDIADQLTAPDGTITRRLMGDFCHPTAEGYRIWGKALQPLIRAYVPE